MSEKRVHILAIERGSLPMLGDGFHQLDLAATHDPMHLWFGPRPRLEQDEAWRQIIPYVVCRYQGRLVRYTRAPSGGEDRLHGKQSIGLGGHIDLADAVVTNGAIDLTKTVRQAANRELAEEIGQVFDVTENTPARTFAGIIIDDSNAVGRVHVGLVALVEISRLEADAIEHHLENVELVSPAQIAADIDRLENWSRILVPHLAALAAAASPVDHNGPET